MARLTTALLRRVHASAVRNAAAQALLTEAMRNRYGCTHSDVDCDPLIDALDYGATPAAPSLDEVDAEMARCGVIPQNPEPKP